MSSSKALESLIAYYTDSENEDDENRDETIMELETSDVTADEIENYDLPPEPVGECSIDLQEKVSKIYNKIQKDGLDLNAVIQSKKEFRNPGMYEKLIASCGLNEFGTNYPPHIFDLSIWGKESHYDELAKVQKIEMDKREKQKKALKATKVEIVSGIAKKVTATNGGVNTVVMTDVTKRKKSKWDR